MSHVHLSVCRPAHSVRTHFVLSSVHPPFTHTPSSRSLHTLPFFTPPLFHNTTLCCPSSRCVWTAGVHFAGVAIELCLHYFMWVVLLMSMLCIFPYPRFTHWWHIPCTILLIFALAIPCLHPFSPSLCLRLFTLHSLPPQKIYSLTYSQPASQDLFVFGHRSKKKKKDASSMKGQPIGRTMGNHSTGCCTEDVLRLGKNKIDTSNSVDGTVEGQGSALDEARENFSTIFFFVLLLLNKEHLWKSGQRTKKDEGALTSCRQIAQANNL